MLYFAVDTHANWAKIRVFDTDCRKHHGLGVGVTRVYIDAQQLYSLISSAMFAYKICMDHHGLRDRSEDFLAEADEMMKEHRGVLNA
jgi:hypothetical protein